MGPADSFHLAQIATGRGVEVLVSRIWRNGMRRPEDWPDVSRRLSVTVAAGQVRAAERAGQFAADALGVDSLINPRSFAGLASDGRSLDGLLYSGVVRARSASGPMAERMAAGGQWMAGLAKTMVADAGRAATQATIAATPRAGWVRLVRPSCCQRCAVLAGKWFRWNEGFRRHPLCDCVHRPALSAPPPDYSSSIAPSQIHDLTEAQRRAIDEGADVNQVINAYRRSSKSRESYLLTTEGMSKHGTARNALGRSGKRLTPDGIFRIAESREEAVRLLVEHGYILPNVPLGRGGAAGYGQFGRGGKRVAARNAVEQANAAGVRAGDRYTMTAAERRMHDAKVRLNAARKSGDSSEIAAAEKAYQRWFATSGQIYT